MCVRERERANHAGLLAAASSPRSSLPMAGRPVRPLTRLAWSRRIVPAEEVPDQRRRAEDSHPPGDQLSDSGSGLAVQEADILEIQLERFPLGEGARTYTLEYGNPVGHERALDLERYHACGLACPGDPNHGWIRVSAPARARRPHRTRTAPEHARLAGPYFEATARYQPVDHRVQSQGLGRGGNSPRRRPKRSPAERR